MRVTLNVYDLNNEPLAWANVLVVNNGIKTNYGNFADVNGKVVLDSSLLTNNSVLQISYMGFETRNITISQLLDENFEIYLQEVNQLEEVTIYGTKKSKGLSWWWLLIAGAVGFGIYKATEKKPKKVTI